MFLLYPGIFKKTRPLCLFINYRQDSNRRDGGSADCQGTPPDQPDPMDWGRRPWQPVRFRAQNIPRDLLKGR